MVAVHPMIFLVLLGFVVVVVIVVAVIIALVADRD